jgi:hypothetical protein
MRIQAAGLNRTTPGEKLSIILDLVRNWRESNHVRRPAGCGPVMKMMSISRHLPDVCDNPLSWPTDQGFPT